MSSTQGGLTGPRDDGDQFGAASTAVGDLNGDGTVDIIVATVNDDDGDTDRGAVYVLFMDGCRKRRIWFTQ